MHRATRLKVLLWFAFVAGALVFAGWAGYGRLSAMIQRDNEQRILAKLDHIDDVLQAADELYGSISRSAMDILNMLSANEGEPTLIPGPPGALPILRFGETEVTGTGNIVDEVTRIMGGTATLFAKQGNEFLRVATTVQTKDGQRAVGTVLDPSGPAYAALVQGKSYQGPADILGHTYITIYEPIFSSTGEILGASYVGYPIETLATLKDSIEDHSLLTNGFFALLAPNGRILFRTSGVADSSTADDVARAAAEGLPPPKGWLVKTQKFAPWDFTIVAATLARDVNLRTLEILWQAYAIGAVVILAVLLASFWLVGRLSDALSSAEKSREEAVAARDAAESANRTKSTFLANMSHELRTPMNAIIGYSEMLIEEAGDLGQKEFLPDLQKIRNAGHHLLSLINDVLDLSKIEAGKMSLFYETFEVRPVVEDVAATVGALIQKNQNTLEIDCPESLGSLRADLTKVRQTLLNLLSNASKFTENGTIILAVREITKEGESFVEFSVRDSGIGMTPEQLGRLFQAFTQADSSTTKKYGGTGLGLVICKRFCEMMSGSISVESQPGVGTTFRFDLPRNGREEVSAQESPVTQKPSLHGPRGMVLVIDDDPDSGALIARGLEKHGYKTTVASSGAAGLEMARSLKPVAITLDVMMPGMDGWSVLGTLKADPETSSIPVIMVTMLSDRQLGYTLGAAEFLTKPVDQEKLRSVLSGLVGTGGVPVLVVDDDPGNRQLLSRLLNRDGYEVLEVEDGLAALDVLKSHVPAVILLDLMMPRMDGFEFLSRLRSTPSTSSIPVVVVTAKDLTAEDRQVLEGSVNEVVQKGAISQEALLASVAGLIGGKKS